MFTVQCQLKIKSLLKYVKKGVLSKIDKSLVASTFNNIDICHENLPIERALGIQSTIESDTFGFTTTLKEKRDAFYNCLIYNYDAVGFIASALLE